MAKKEHRQVSIYVPKDLYRKVEEEAKEQLRSVSNQILFILRGHYMGDEK